MKSLKLAGAFDADSKPHGAPDTLYMMAYRGREVEEIAANEARWNTHHEEVSKAMAQGLPILSDEIIDQAMLMQRGNIPKSVWNNKVLGLEVKKDVITTPVGQAKSINNGGTRTPTHSGITHQSNAAHRAAKVEAVRPQRNNAKRRYGDANFEGYGEGYADDDAHDPGYSTGDGEDAMGGRKRPKKVGYFMRNIVLY